MDEQLAEVSQPAAVRSYVDYIIDDEQQRAVV